MIVNFGLWRAALRLRLGKSRKESTHCDWPLLANHSTPWACIEHFRLIPALPWRPVAPMNWRGQWGIYVYNIYGANADSANAASANAAGANAASTNAASADQTINIMVFRSIHILEAWPPGVAIAPLNTLAMFVCRHLNWNTHETD